MAALEGAPAMHSSHPRLAPRSPSRAPPSIPGSRSSIHPRAPRLEFRAIQAHTTELLLAPRRSNEPTQPPSTSPSSSPLPSPLSLSPADSSPPSHPPTMRLSRVLPLLSLAFVDVSAVPLAIDFSARPLPPRDDRRQVLLHHDLLGGRLLDPEPRALRLQQGSRRLHLVCVPLLSLCPPLLLELPDSPSSLPAHSLQFGLRRPRRRLRPALYDVVDLQERGARQRQPVLRERLLLLACVHLLPRRGALSS